MKQAGVKQAGVKKVESISPLKGNPLHGGIGKEERHGWKKGGPAGALVWLDKHELHVDPSYQRHDSDVAVLRIAANWDWISFGAIVVSKRDGQLWVVDGQHRVLASLRRSDINKLPAVLFDDRSVPEEAGGFLGANLGRKAPSVFDRWKGQILLGDETTIMLDKLIRDSGRIPSNSAGPNAVSCLSSLLNIANSGHREELLRVWPIIMEVCMGHPVTERLVNGLVYIESYMEHGSLTEKRYRDALVTIGFQELWDATAKAMSFYSRGGDKVWAIGILEKLNYKKRTPITLRIPLKAPKLRGAMGEKKEDASS